MANEVYIVAACRTPIGAFKGQFEKMSAIELMKPVMQELLVRGNVRSEDIEEVYVGNVLTAGKGQNPARQAAISAGYAIETPCTTLNMVCGSGLKAVALAFNNIKSRHSDVVMAGGMESMTQAEHAAFMRKDMKFGDISLKDTLVVDGLTDAMFKIPMGITAEEVAKAHNVSREEQDAYALNSQKKCGEAVRANAFSAEIIHIGAIAADEYPKPNTTIEQLQKLRPAFVKENGTVTAGNASGINDGAAGVILVSSMFADSKGLKPLARIIDYAEVGNDPKTMGLAPIYAVQKLFNKLQWSVDNVDLFELNEAFAVQSLVVARELGIPDAKVNVNGGAIALGHPIGASGARVLVTLIYALMQQKKKVGVCGLCIGGGLGIAMAIEICDQDQA